MLRDTIADLRRRVDGSFGGIGITRESCGLPAGWGRVGPRRCRGRYASALALTPYRLFGKAHPSGMSALEGLALPGYFNGGQEKEPKE